MDMSGGRKLTMVIAHGDRMVRAGGGDDPEPADRCRVTQVNSSTYHRKTAVFFLVSVCSVLFILPVVANAHEKWCLTPQQVAELNAQPRPYIFSHLTPVTLAMYAFTLFFVAGMIWMNYTKARELFLGWQVWLASRGAYASLSLRIALFILLGMAGLGLGPRMGTALFEAPTLAAPDLELRLAGPGWLWIAWVEVVLAGCFIFGIYVRAAAAVLIGLVLLGLHLFGWGMLDYIGLIAGAAVYLLLRGAGPYGVPMPAIRGTSKISAWLADQPRARAQWLLQILVGFNFAWLGITYKFFQPNLMITILHDQHVPTFGIAAPLFVLSMALVEGLSGLLIMAGILIRFQSAILFVSFIFFSAILGEGVFGHIIFYGLLGTFITNGDGQWSRATNLPLPRSARARLSATPSVVAAALLQGAAVKADEITGPPIHQEPELAEVTPFHGPPPAAAKRGLIITADGLVAELLGKLQQAAEKAAQAAVGKQVDEAVRRALAHIEDARQSSTQELRALRSHGNGNGTEETASRWKQQMELSLGRMDESAQRLDQQAAELRRELTKSQEIVEKTTREIELQIQARLNDTVAEATSQFEHAAARAVERRYERLLENSHIAMQDALLKMEARSAEVQALMQSAVISALGIFQRQSEMQANLVLSETKERAGVALSSLEAETRAACDARRQSLVTEVARAAERSTEQFHKGMKAFLYSCLVAAVGAVDEHSKVTLAGLQKNNGKAVLEAESDSSAKDDSKVIPGTHIGPLTDLGAV